MENSSTRSRSVGTISKMTGYVTKRKTGQLTSENKQDEIQTDCSTLRETENLAEQKCRQIHSVYTNL